MRQGAEADAAVGEMAYKMRSEGGVQLVCQRELFLGSQKPRERNFAGESIEPMMLRAWLG